MSSSSKSEQSSKSSGTSQSFIAPFQVPFFEQLFGQAQGVANQQLGQIGDQAGQLAGRLGDSGNAFLAGLQGIAGGNFGAGVGNIAGSLANLGGSQYAQQLSGSIAGAQPGQSTLQALAGGGQFQSAAQGLIGDASQQLLGENPGLQSSISALDAAIQNNLKSTAGTIAGQATLAGATGGSRQALATGLAGEEASRQFGQGAASLVSQDFATRQQLAPQLLGAQLGAAELLDRGALANSQQQLQAASQLQQGGQFNQGILGQLLGFQQQGLAQAGQLGLGQIGAQTGAAQTGLGQLGNLFNLGLSPFQAQFSPLQALSGIFGSPTVLQQSSQNAKGSGSRASFSFG